MFNFFFLIFVWKCPPTTSLVAYSVNSLLSFQNLKIYTFKAKNLILNTIWSTSYKFDMKGLFCYFLYIIFDHVVFSLIQEAFRRFIFVFNYEIGRFLKYFLRIISLLLKNVTCSNRLLKLIEFLFAYYIIKCCFTSTEKVCIIP